MHFALYGLIEQMTTLFISGMLALTIGNPNSHQLAWSSSARLSSIDLVYRKQGSQTWNDALDSTGNALAFPTAVAAVC